MEMKNYSDDNCICKAETIDKECPRHGELSRFKLPIGENEEQ